jgi:hypothetical protein
MAVLNAAVAGFANRSRDLLTGGVIIEASNFWHYDSFTIINRSPRHDAGNRCRRTIIELISGTRLLTLSEWSRPPSRNSLSRPPARRARSLRSTSPSLLMRRHTGVGHFQLLSAAWPPNKH